LIFPLPSILLNILFSFIASPLVWLFLGLLLIYHLQALSFLSTLLPLQILSLVKVFHKDQSLAHSYSYSTLLLSVLLSLICLSVIIYMPMTLNCSSPSGHLNSLPIFYTYKIKLIVSQWMSAYILSLNHFNTEFHLIGLPSPRNLRCSPPFVKVPNR